MKVKAASLKLVEGLYPRQRISDYHVAELQRAVEAGEILPPVIADKKTLKVVDGWHRVTRALRYDGEDAEIEVEFRDYKNDGEMFLDACRLNARHGENLTPVDRVHCAEIGRRMGLTAEQIAAALLMDPERLQAKREARTAKFGRQIVILKGPFTHMSGTQLTEGQSRANDSALGVSQIFLVNRVIDMLEQGMLNTADDPLMERIELLAGLLQKYVRKSKVA